MHRMIKQLVVFGCLVLIASVGVSFAEVKGPQGSKEEAQAMIEKAAIYYKKYGRDKLLLEISLAGTEKKGEFIDRDLYLFAYDFNGVNVAHGANPKLVGQNLFDMQDADGRYLIRGLIDTAQKGSKWYFYKWTNPLTKKIDDKLAYVLKLDNDLWIGCGVYGTAVHASSKKRIGVFMMFEQAKYNEALKGMREQLEKNGYKEPEVTFTVENAQGSQLQAVEKVRKLAAAKPDLFFTIGTAATLAVAKEVKDVPIVFSIVYDPVADNIVKDWQHSGNNATGMATKIPTMTIMQHLSEFGPVKRMVVLYTPAEKNSVSQLKELQAVESEAKIKIVPVAINNKEELTGLLPEVMHTADAIYLTGSNSFYAQIPAIVEAANRAKVITVTHLDDLVAKGVLFGVCTDSYRNGSLAGEKAVRILKGENPSAIAIDTPQPIDVILNRKSAGDGQFQVPAAFMKTVTKTVE